jgi:hypothetical protein
MFYIRNFKKLSEVLGGKIIQSARHAFMQADLVEKQFYSDAFCKVIKNSGK